MNKYHRTDKQSQTNSCVYDLLTFVMGAKKHNEKNIVFSMNGATET